VYPAQSTWWIVGDGWFVTVGAPSCPVPYGLRSVFRVVARRVLPNLRSRKLLSGYDAACGCRIERRHSDEAQVARLAAPVRRALGPGRRDRADRPGRQRPCADRLRRLRLLRRHALRHLRAVSPAHLGPAGRGDSLVTRCWGRVPSTSAGMSEEVYPISLKPLGVFRRCMNHVIRSARIVPASCGLARDTSAPNASAACKWRFGSACAVKRKTAGALRITETPCGTSG